MPARQTNNLPGFGVNTFPPTRTGTKVVCLKTATKDSLRKYKHHASKFGKWCKTEYKCRHMDDCRPYIQAYADYLQQQGKSASTIHTYLAGVCCAFAVTVGNYLLAVDTTMVEDKL